MLGKKYELLLPFHEERNITRVELLRKFSISARFTLSDLGQNYAQVAVNCRYTFNFYRTRIGLPYIK